MHEKVLKNMESVGAETDEPLWTRKEHWEMLKTILTVEEGEVPDSEAWGWNMKETREVSRRGSARGSGVLRMEARNGSWNIAASQQRAYGLEAAEKVMGNNPESLKYQEQEERQDSSKQLGLEAEQMMRGSKSRELSLP